MLPAEETMPGLFTQGKVIHIVSTYRFCCRLKYGLHPLPENF